MTLQPGDRVRLTPEHGTSRSASLRARRDWPTGSAWWIKSAPFAMGLRDLGRHRHADQEQICVLEKVE
jgi:hypothetical protein